MILSKDFAEALFGYELLFGLLSTQVCPLLSYAL